MAQMQTAYSTLIRRDVATQGFPSSLPMRRLAKDGKAHPRIITLGGDHSIVLPILRSLHAVYGEIAVVHFDSHLDTWPILGYLGMTDESIVTHGTMFWTAMKEGLITKENSIHAGIRCKLQVCDSAFLVFIRGKRYVHQGSKEIERDERVGFSMITTDDIDQLGADGIVEAIKKRVGDKPVYLRYESLPSCWYYISDVVQVLTLMLLVRLTHVCFAWVDLHVFRSCLRARK
jgi:agmatinase